MLRVDALRALLPFPTLVTLLDYWHARVDAQGRMPRRRLDPADLVAELPYVFILDVVPDAGSSDRKTAPAPIPTPTASPTASPTPSQAHRFRYRLCGTVIQDVMGRSVVGLTLEEFRRGPVLDHLNLLFGRAAQETLAGYGISDLVGESSTVATYHRLCLPMTTDGHRVDQLLGGWIPSFENPSCDPNELSQSPEFGERPGRMFFASAGGASQRD